MASKYEELECLYAAVGKVIYEGLTNYEKATSANPSQLFGERVSIVVFPAWSSCALDELFLLGPRGADPLQAKIFLGVTVGSLYILHGSFVSAAPCTQIQLTPDRVAL